MCFDVLTLFAYCPPWFAAVGVLLTGTTFLVSWWTVASYFDAHDAANNQFEQVQATRMFARSRRVLFVCAGALFLWLTLVAALAHMETPG